MIVFLHGHYPRDIIKGDRAEAEIGVIRDLADLLHEGVEVWCWDAVYGGDEVGRGEAVLVGGRTTALEMLSAFIHFKRKATGRGKVPWR